MSLKDTIYYTDDYIKEILFTTKSIAIIGLSDKENRPSNFAAKYLKNRGFKFVGKTIVYAFMQAMGIVNDHTINCFRNQEIAILNSKNRDDF